MTSKLMWFVGGIVATYALMRSRSGTAREIVSQVDAAVVRLWGPDKLAAQGSSPGDDALASGGCVGCGG